MSDILKYIENWFKIAVPEPTDGNRHIQLGCLLEEVDEMIYEIDTSNEGYNLSFYCIDRNLTIDELGRKLKRGYIKYKSISNKQAFADALADQVVTLVGLAQFHGIDLIGALQEVNRSNWSKFENGKPVFDENGKITKGKDYTPPDLSQFVRE